MRLAKYIHLLNGYDLKFQKPLVEFIDNPQNGFDKSQHLFITPHQMVYENLKVYGNVMLDETKEHLINKYAPQCDFIICQGVPDVKTMLKIKRRHLRKTVFRTWGGSHQPAKRKDYTIGKYCIERIKDLAYKLYVNLTIGKCPALGIANMVDVIDTRRWLKNITLIPLNFGLVGTFDLIQNVKEIPIERSNTKNIMVGHQGDPNEKHYYFVKKLLERFGDEDINIYVSLSYGNKAYIDETVEKLRRLNNPKVFVLTELVAFRDYLQFLNTIDVAILDTKTSMALGNIGLLLSLDKKVVLHAEGVIKETFDYLKIPCITSCELDDISFERLMEPAEYGEAAKEIKESPLSKQRDYWHNLFTLLEDGRK